MGSFLTALLASLLPLSPTHWSPWRQEAEWFTSKQSKANHIKAKIYWGRKWNKAGTGSPIQCSKIKGKGDSWENLPDSSMYSKSEHPPGTGGKDISWSRQCHDLYFALGGSPQPALSCFPSWEPSSGFTLNVLLQCQVSTWGQWQVGM